MTHTTDSTVTAPWAVLAEDVLDLLRNAELKLLTFHSCDMIWKFVLTKEQRDELGGDFEAACAKRGSFISAWMRLRNVSQARAPITLAHRLQLIPEATYRWLDREISKVDPTPSSAVDVFQNSASQTHADDERDINEKIRNAGAEKDLVIVFGNGKYLLYWKGKRVIGPQNGWGYHPKLWELLTTAARAAHERRTFRWDELTYRKEGSNDIVIDRKSRLHFQIPADLHILFEQIDSETHRLNLPAKQIEFIEVKPGEWIEEH